MGLNDSYMIIREQILMIKLFTTICVAYSLILQEEEQWDITISSNISHEDIARHVSYENTSEMKLTCNLKHPSPE